ncbi:MAG TPA: hypothetical protein VM051_06620 [Usitatibacter sp.]|nr:hypothetical protein [Usitatibacter sp.]
MRTLAFAMGLLSLMASVVAGVGLWLLFEFGPHPERDGPAPELTKLVASASCESLQKICPLLASDYDNVSEANRANFRRHHELLRGMLFGALAWGVVSAVCFLYIHVKTRRAESDAAGRK